MATEARKLVWMGAIPLQLHLHHSEATTLPPPSPSLILAPRNGYLPLLVPAIKPHFQSALPPGQDTVWFDYQGLPLKWHIPTGVLFDLLCAEPERPWNLTVHFRAYPSELLIPCEGEDAIKWNFINSLKEASYIMHGSTKNVMNLSQSDQLDLWRSVVKGDLESYNHVSSRLKPCLVSSSSIGGTSSKGLGDAEILNSKTRAGGEILPVKIPFRLYVRTIKTDIEDILDVPPIESWDEVSYITRPVDVCTEEGSVLTLRDALIKIAPQLFSSLCFSAFEEAFSSNQTRESPSKSSLEVAARDPSLPFPSNLESEDVDAVTGTSLIPKLEKGPAKSQELFRQSIRRTVRDKMDSFHLRGHTHEFLNGILRIQGIEPSLDLPIDWIAHNFCGQEQFVHVCIVVWNVGNQSNKL